jgi:hypothetical protein
MGGKVSNSRYALRESNMTVRLNLCVTFDLWAVLESELEAMLQEDEVVNSTPTVNCTSALFLE